MINAPTLPTDQTQPQFKHALYSFFTPALATFYAGYKEVSKYGINGSPEPSDQLLLALNADTFVHDSTQGVKLIDPISVRNAHIILNTVSLCLSHSFLLADNSELKEVRQLLIPALVRSLALASKLCDTKLNLSNVCLDGLNLRKLDLTGTNLTGSSLKVADLADANLTGANLDQAILNRAILIDVDLTNTNFTDTETKNIGITSNNPLLKSFL